MIHGKAMAVVIAYDIYLECCAGALDASWKVSRPVDFHRFREKLALQCLQYSPKHCKYPGDERFREHTQLKKNNRTRTNRSSNSVSSGSVTTYTTSSGIGAKEVEEASGRLCGFLDELLEHERSIAPIPNKGHAVCLCCGKQAYTKCNLCPNKPAIHMNIPKGRRNSCFIHYHNTASFGKWRNDWSIVTGLKRKRQWVYPDSDELQQHASQMKQLHLSLCLPIQTTQTPPETPPEGSNEETSEDWNRNCI